MDCALSLRMSPTHSRRSHTSEVNLSRWRAPFENISYTLQESTLQRLIFRSRSAGECGLTERILVGIGPLPVPSPPVKCIVNLSSNHHLHQRHDNIFVFTLLAAVAVVWYGSRRVERNETQVQTNSRLSIMACFV